MAKESKIEWTHATFNPWIGCTKVSPGCQHCYAEAQDKRWGHQRWGPKAPRTRTSKSYWDQPLKWNAEAAASGQQFRVFCASLADVCEDRDDLLAHRADLMRLIEQTPALIWLLLTKRPENFERFFGVRWTPGGWPKNVWAMCSVVNQAEAEKKIDALAQVPAAVRGLSMEPLLGPVNIRKWLLTHIDWVIVGGESGVGARPMHPDWARDLRDQCQEFDVAFLFKQWGEWESRTLSDDRAFNSLASHNRDRLVDQAGNVHCTREAAGAAANPMSRVGKHAAGRLLDGRTWDEFPSAAVPA